MMTLSNREKEVAENLLTGASNKEIASNLYISKNTVITHMKRIREKLDAKNNVEVAVKFLQQIDDPATYLKHLSIALFFMGLQSSSILDGYNNDMRVLRAKTRTHKTARRWKS